MKNTRIFSEEELKEIGKLTKDAAIEAINSGNKEKAVEMVNRMYKEAQNTLDSYADWVTEFMDYIYVHSGADALEDALRKRFDRTEGKRIDTYLKKDIRGRVEAHVASCRCLLQNVIVTEDDEKICIQMNPCGTGQRLMERHAYEPPRNLSKIEACGITFGKNDFPIYCTHGAIAEIIQIEKLGKPLFVHDLPDEFGKQPCKFCFYKNDEDVPEKFYQRVGKEKRPGRTKK